jgi:hypothetical protein
MIKGRKIKILSGLLLAITLLLTNVQLAYASTDYAKNAGTWLSNQIFWIGLIFAILALVGCIMKRNYTGAVITVLGSGIILYFIKNPEKISTIGEGISKIIFP